jgi:hypothetical protein
MNLGKVMSNIDHSPGLCPEFRGKVLA